MDINNLHGTEGIEIKFSHVQLYVDRVGPVDEYKELEAAINKFYSFAPGNNGVVAAEDLGDIVHNTQRSSGKVKTAFQTHGRDVVKVRPV